MDRRAYINRVARGGLLGALAVTSGILVFRRQVEPGAGCTGGSQCRNCRKLQSCELPDALNERTDEKG